MPKDLHFDDETILSTPNPIQSSSMQSNRPNLSDLDDMPQRLSDVSEESLGLLSMNCIDDASKEHRKQISRAVSSLKNSIPKLTSIPSRYIRKSDLTNSECGHSDFDYKLHSESTISESDLLLTPSNSSTPKSSLLMEEFPMRQSISQSISNMAKSIRDPNVGLNEICTKFTNELSFQSGCDMMAQLEKDEISWQKRHQMPTELKEFSLEESKTNIKLSLGCFFQQRSDDPHVMFAKSPLKQSQPIALLEPSLLNPKEKDSLNESDIKHMLSSDKSFSNVLVDLYNYNKPNNKKAMKENVSPDLISDEKSSTRSSSALSSLPDGKLPICSSKKEIVWGCTKPGRSVSKDVIIRNSSSNRFSIQCDIANPLFRLAKENETSSILKINLHPYESRTITVTFTPNAIGCAVDRLAFTTPDPILKHKYKQFIKLFAYGGHGNVTITNLVKDTSGKYLLALGNLDTTLHFEQSFIIKNLGTLPTFSSFSFVPNGLDTFYSVEFLPKFAILQPNEETDITVRCNLQKHITEYLKSKASSSVIDFGKIIITNGTEVDRIRLRKICRKAIESGCEVPQYVSEIIEPLPDDMLVKELRFFNEIRSSIDDILKGFDNVEVVLTFEQTIDQTMINRMEDESILFQSLCGSATFLDDTLKEAFTLEPTRIILTPPEKVIDRIFLTNNTKNSQCFEVMVNSVKLLVKPKSGLIQSGETAVFELQYNFNECIDKNVFTVKILVDNDCFNVDVKVMYLFKK